MAYVYLRQCYTVIKKIYAINFLQLAQLYLAQKYKRSLNVYLFSQMFFFKLTLIFSTFKSVKPVDVLCTEYILLYESKGEQLLRNKIRQVLDRTRSIVWSLESWSAYMFSFKRFESSTVKIFKTIIYQYKHWKGFFFLVQVFLKAIRDSERKRIPSPGVCSSENRNRDQQEDIKQLLAEILHLTKDSRNCTLVVCRPPWS